MTKAPSKPVENKSKLPELQVHKLGLIDYGPALELQESTHARVTAGATEKLYLLEHTPVITTGRNTGKSNILVSEDFLREKDIALFETGRGGDVTYHGPGQLVGYPILHLREGERDIKRYVHALEEWLIQSAAEFGVVATRVEGLRGIWVGNEKLAAIGVRIANWTTMHGFALNVSTDLNDFNHIIPCGLSNKGVTSLEKLLGKAPSMDEVCNAFIQRIPELLKRNPVLQKEL